MDQKRTDSLKQFFKFLFFSIGAGIIEFIVFTLITLIDSHDKVIIAIADVTSVVLSCLFNYTINRKFTFKSCNNLVVGMILYGAYYAIATPAGAAFILFLTGRGWNPLLAKATKMILNFFLDFTFCKLVIFRLGEKKLVSSEKQ